MRRPCRRWFQEALADFGDGEDDGAEHRRRHWDEETPATEPGVLWGLHVQRTTKPQTILLSEPNRNNTNVMKRFNSMLKL